MPTYCDETDDARPASRSARFPPEALGTQARRGKLTGRHARRQRIERDIAQATIFLLSDEASYITGQSLVVDEGLSTLR